MSDPRPELAVSAGPSEVTRAAARGLSWSALRELAGGLGRFVTTAILARYLSKEDFGLYGLAILFFEFFTLFSDVGFGAAIVQRAHCTQRLLSTNFWANLSIGLALYAILCATAPLGAAFFDAPELAPMLWVLGLSFVLGPLSNTNVNLLQRRLQFNRLAAIELTATAAYMAVVLGLVVGLGFRYWGLVWALMASRVVTLVMRHATCRWRPGWQFSWHDLRELVGFGKSIYGQRVLNYAASKADRLVIGKGLGAGQLGLYSLASALPHLALTHFSSIILGLLFPLFCRLKDDLARLREGFLKVIRFIALFTFPTLAGMALLAADLVRLVYGEPWLVMVPAMQILCASAALRSVLTATGYVFNARGRPDISFKWELAFTPWALVCVGVGALWGIQGVAAAMVLSLVPCLILLVILCRTLEMGLRRYFAAWQPAVLCTLGMAAVVLAVGASLPTDASAGLRLAVAVPAGLLAYVALVRVIYPAVYLELWEFLTLMVVGRSRRPADARPHPPAPTPEPVRGGSLA